MEDSTQKIALVTGASSGFGRMIAKTPPDDADPTEVGRMVRDLVGRPHGSRPLRSYVDPADDGAAVSFPVIDRIRSEFLHCIGVDELLHARVRESSNAV